MKFTIDRNQLLKHIKDLGTKEGPKTRLNEVIRFVATGRNKLRMTIVNAFKSTMFSVTIPATVQIGDTLMVQRSQFQSALELAEPGEVCIKGEDGNLSIGTDVKVQLHTVEMDGYCFDLHDPITPLVLPITTFRAMVADVKHAICKDETKYNLNYVYFHDEGAEAVAVTTDGHRLARTGRMWQSVPTGGVLFPDSMIPLMSLVKDNEAMITAGYWSPPPPPVEYETIFRFKDANDNKATYLADSFMKHIEQQERMRNNDIEKAGKGTATEATYYQDRAAKTGTYLVYLRAIKPEQREKQFNLPKYFVVQCGDYHFTKRHDDGEFPTYGKVVPQGDPTFAFRVNVKGLQSLLSRLPVSKTLNGVRLTFTATECSVSRDCVDTGITFQKSIPVTADVFPKETSVLSTRFSQKYIQDILKVVGRELVITSTEPPHAGEVQNLRPVKFLDGDREERLFVVMPMRL